MISPQTLLMRWDCQARRYAVFAMNSYPVNLTKLFQSGVDAVVGDAAVSRALNTTPLASLAPVYILAVGKAADAMIRGAVDALPDTPVRGLMITKLGHISDAVLDLPWLEIIESAHPVPNQRSLDAGAAAVEFVQRVPESAQLLVLMSGGASALMEHLIDGLGLLDLQHLNESLLAGGLPIDAMNRYRKTVSCIKGGKLSAYLPAVPVTQLLLSDVPGDAITDIGSGPLALPHDQPEPHPGDRLGELLGRAEIFLSKDLIACVNAFGSTAPLQSDPVWSRIQSRVVGSSAIAQQAVVTSAKQQGIAVVQSSGSLHGDVQMIADHIGQVLSTDAKPGLYVWGGETHLVLPPNPGRGGRNQHLALEVARRIEGRADLSVLCCGTDGSDGPTTDAGAQVSASTVSKGREIGLSIEDYLQRADAGSYLAAVDALICTGPTGTNVMDLVIAYKL